ncbi:MAG: hypothetical protein ACYT04_50115, partial [Nostoc sp.]
KVSIHEFSASNTLVENSQADLLRVMSLGTRIILQLFSYSGESQCLNCQQTALPADNKRGAFGNGDSFPVGRIIKC